MGKLHTNAYRSLPTVCPALASRPRLVHAADTAEDRIAYARDVLGYERVSTDYRAVLEDPDVDVVSICAPNMLHKEIGLAAARAGKHVWIEKPVGRDSGDTAAVAEAAHTAGVVTSVGFNYRHAPAVEEIRRLVAEGTLGRSPTSDRCSSTDMPPNPRQHCRGGSSATWQAAGPWAICSATSPTSCNTPSARSPR